MSFNHKECPTTENAPQHLERVYLIAPQRDSFTEIRELTHQLSGRFSISSHAVPLLQITASPKQAVPTHAYVTSVSAFHVGKMLESSSVL